MVWVFFKVWSPSKNSVGDLKSFLSQSWLLVDPEWSCCHVNSSGAKDATDLTLQGGYSFRLSWRNTEEIFHFVNWHPLWQAGFQKNAENTLLEFLALPFHPDLSFSSQEYTQGFSGMVQKSASASITPPIVAEGRSSGVEWKLTKHLFGASPNDFPTFWQFIREFLIQEKYFLFNSEQWISLSLICSVSPWNHVNLNL